MDFTEQNVCYDPISTQLNSAVCFDVSRSELSKDFEQISTWKQSQTNFRLRDPTPLDRASLGLSTFCAANHPIESCGSNGLPLTPNSVQILGRFHNLFMLEHVNLCTYVEVSRLQHGEIELQS